MHTNNINIGRQPIINSDNHIYAYELLFRNGLVSNASFENDITATLHVMRNLFHAYKKILRNSLGFINVNRDILSKEIINSLPPENYVFALDDLNISGEKFSATILKSFAWNY